MKYSKNFLAGRVLRQFVRDWFLENEEKISDIDFIIPVPIHFFSLIFRGFNQSVFLANTQTQLPVEVSIVRKIRWTRHQAGKTKEERADNVRGAFRVMKPVKGKKILLFDDVCTTGQTLSVMSKCLKKAGASRIDGFVVSRAVF